LASLYQYLCDKNAVTHNPGVKRPKAHSGEGRTPAPTMSDSALIDCVDWIVLGYKIVQSIFPDWKFSAADTVAANGVRGGGALLIETRHGIAPRS
jgi:2-oxo-3-hexenedioate decarboxylase